MSQQERRNDWGVVAAIALIALGVWFLLGNVFGSWWQEAVRQAFRVIWPLALIALGVLIYLSATRGGLGHTTPGKRLYRSRNRMVGGVLGGVADYLGVDPTLVRVLYVLFGVLTGFGPAVVVYIIAMIVVPEEPAASEDVPWSFSTTKTVESPPSSGSGWPHSESAPAPAPPAPPAPTPPGETASDEPNQG